MIQIPMIIAEVTFLAPDEGGRTHLPDLTLGYYMPHLVVQSPDTRRATIVGNRVTEHYLGVRFVDAPKELLPGIPFCCILALMYHPEVDYKRLQSGVTFTVREGPHIVAFGTVLERTETRDANP